MMYVLSSFFSQCFTRLEDKKDAGKLRQRSSGHQLFLWFGQGCDRKRDPRALPAPDSAAFPHTAWFSERQRPPAWGSTGPGPARRWEQRRSAAECGAHRRDVRSAAPRRAQRGGVGAAPWSVTSRCRDRLVGRAAAAGAAIYTQECSANGGLLRKQPMCALRRPHCLHRRLLASLQWVPGGAQLLAVLRDEGWGCSVVAHPRMRWESRRHRARPADRPHSPDPHWLLCSLLPFRHWLRFPRIVLHEAERKGLHTTPARQNSILRVKSYW